MNQQRRAPRRRVDGVVLLDKPQGLSSNAALQRVRRAFNADKAGHTGTLDPMATGLLPICLGEATKFSAQLLDADKGYRATVRLGIETDTGDAEGQVVNQQPVHCTSEQLAHVAQSFVGDIVQIPPMYSALKRDGKPLYEYARAGIELERDARQIKIHRLDVRLIGDVEFIMDVRCSKGTYVRTLAMDIGQALGCGAHLSQLRRTGIADLNVDDAMSLADIEALAVPDIDRILRPVDFLVAAAPILNLDDAQMKRFLHGQRLAGDFGAAGSGTFRIYGPQERFLGLGRMSAATLEPLRLLATHDEQEKTR